MPRAGKRTTMTDLIERVLRSELGSNAQISRYGREHRTPMTVVLDEAERQIGSRFTVYWVDNGPPDVFCLPRFSPSPVIFSVRYLSLSAFLRTLFLDTFSDELRVEVAEHTALKVMAELALRKGDPDYAVLAFVQSVTGKGIWLDDSDQVMELESWPINEAYMATWFYGLVHELGHLHPDRPTDFANTHLFSDENVLGLIKTVLASFSIYPDGVKQRALAVASQPGSNSVLAIGQVRDEGLADMFAASVLLQSTMDIMQELDEEPFDVVDFLQEMVIFLNIIALFDRCRRVALIASTTTPNEAAAFDLGFHPVSIGVRMLMQRFYSDSAITQYLYGPNPTTEQVQAIQSLSNNIAQQFSETITFVERGLARAMEFSLFAGRRPNDWVLLEAYRLELVTNPVASALARAEAQRFCEMADGLGVESKLLRTLKGIVEDPSMPLVPDPSGDLFYVVPWVSGTSGTSRPFGLDTKYGHVIFAFHEQGELYQAFFDASAEGLKPEFRLETTAVLVPRKEQLGPELAANMPDGKTFQVVVEGSDQFVRYMEELANDTIW
jgi:hypothetical protein